MASSYFARIENGIVQEVIAATQDVVDARPGVWVRTWYQANGDPLKGYNYAGVGDTYDAVNNAFHRPQPFPSWTLNAAYTWVPPTPEPADGKNHRWNEANQTWDEVGF